MGRPQPGDRINNYLLDELIGTGSFGEVWRARHHVFKEPVAIKVPTDAQFVRQLQREGMAVHGLRDPSIVRALDMDPYAEPPYLIMEYIDGPSLRALIETQGARLPLGVAMAALHGTLLALNVAHTAGVVHRDIKPENILISGRDGLDALTPDRVKVTDFGLGMISGTAGESILQSGSIETQTGKRLTGTLAYMSPEQRDGQPVDGRSDLYSVGVLLHEMLTGVLPQGTDLPGDQRQGLPKFVDRLFERCYTRRERRFASAAEMLRELERNWEPSAAFAAHRSGNVRRIQRNGNAWHCAGCSGVIRQADQFCIHCGRQLAEDIPRCPSCQAFIGRHDCFCILCGKPLKEAG